MSLAAIIYLIFTAVNAVFILLTDSYPLFLMLTVLVGVGAVMLAFSFVQWLFIWPAKTELVGNSVVVTVKNRWIFPVFYGYVTVEGRYCFFGKKKRSRIYFSAPPLCKRRIVIDARGEIPAKMSVKVKRICIADPLHLFVLPKRIKDEKEIFVMPEKCTPAKTSGPSFEEIMPQNMFDEELDSPCGYHSLRDTDPLSKIHWKLSARLDELVAKEFEKNDNDESPVIFFDPCLTDLKRKGRGEYSQKIFNIKGASSLLCERGIVHRICVYERERDLCHTVFIGGEGDIDDALKTVMGIEPYTGEPVGSFGEEAQGDKVLFV